MELVECWLWSLTGCVRGIAGRPDKVMDVTEVIARWLQMHSSIWRAEQVEVFMLLIKLLRSMPIHVRRDVVGAILLHNEVALRRPLV